MQRQFPHLADGFQSTLLLPTLLPFDSWMPNYIQIVQVQSQRHWITVTTKDCSCGEVIVYDTLYDNVDFSTKTMLERLFSCGKEGLSYKMADGIQKQQGVTDCGIFTLTFAVSLAYMYDNSSPPPIFQQDKLRSHLIACMEAQHFTIFPKVH